MGHRAFINIIFSLHRYPLKEKPRKGLLISMTLDFTKLFVLSTRENEHGFKPKTKMHVYSYVGRRWFPLQNFPEINSDVNE